MKWPVLRSVRRGYPSGALLILEVAGIDLKREAPFFYQCSDLGATSVGSS